MTTRVLLVDDHATLRDALALAIEREPDLEVAGQAGTVAEALAVTAAVDLALVDLGLQESDGAEVIRQLRARHPSVVCVVVTGSSNRAEHARAIAAGAVGVLSKSTPLPELLAAVRRAAAGEALLSSAELLALLRDDSLHRAGAAAALGPEGLTRREHEVLQALAEGLSDKEIGARLEISSDTVRTHMSNILTKLGVESRLQALIVAIRAGLVRLP